MPRALTLVLIFFGVIAVALFFMPLRLAVGMAGLEDSGFSAKQISGSIWNGRLEGAQLNAFPLGDLDAGLQILPLLAGKIRLDVERSASAKNDGLNATIGMQGKGLSINDANATLIAGQQLSPLPASSIELDDVSIAFVDNRCRSASGQVRLSLDANIPGLDLKQGLLGPAECQDGVLLLPLVSGSGMEQLTIKLEGSGLYTARLFLSGKESTWTLLLPSLGFRKVPGGYAMKIEGRFEP